LATLEQHYDRLVLTMTTLGAIDERIFFHEAAAVATKVGAAAIVHVGAMGGVLRAPATPARTVTTTTTAAAATATTTTAAAATTAAVVVTKVGAASGLTPARASFTLTPRAAAVVGAAPVVRGGATPKIPAAAAAAAVVVGAAPVQRGGATPKTPAAAAAAAAATAVGASAPSTPLPERSM
jgi:flagellar hook-length control protein FliK